jgi:hypothetical protein
MDLPAVDLTTLEGLRLAVQARGTVAIARFEPNALYSEREVGDFDGTFCSGCGATRRMKFMTLYWPISLMPEDATQLFTKQEELPGLFGAVCLQCQGALTIMLALGPRGPEVLSVPSSYGGLSTPKTPPQVAFYLDQAQRAHSAGAISGSVSMFRAALEQLLFEQGYKSGMLKAKIDALTADKEPPEWAARLNPAFLTAIKDLGNAAIHPNDGDISKQATIDLKLLLRVRALFVYLLEEIYELPERRAAELRHLQEAAETFSD